MAKEKRDEIMYYGGWKQDQLAKPPVFGLPTVYCVNTKQFLCSYTPRPPRVLSSSCPPPWSRVGGRDW